VGGGERIESLGVFGWRFWVLWYETVVMKEGWVSGCAEMGGWRFFGGGGVVRDGRVGGGRRGGEGRRGFWFDKKEGGGLEDSCLIFGGLGRL